MVTECAHSLAELALPTCVMDIKLHNIVHLVCRAASRAHRLSRTASRVRRSLLLELIWPSPCAHTNIHANHLFVPPALTPQPEKIFHNGPLRNSSLWAGERAGGVMKAQGRNPARVEASSIRGWSDLELIGDKKVRGRVKKGVEGCKRAATPATPALTTP